MSLFTEVNIDDIRPTNALKDHIPRLFPAQALLDDRRLQAEMQTRNCCDSSERCSARQMLNEAPTILLHHLALEVDDYVLTRAQYQS